MAIENRELFSKNKIQEAICQFTFKSPLDLTKMKELSTQLVSTDRYHSVEELPFFQFNINLINLDDRASQTQQLIGYKILNGNKDKVIQLFANNLSIHQVGNYESWECFSADIQFVLEKFASFYDVEIGRIDLRTINNFDFISQTNMKQYLSLNLDVPSAFGTNNAVSFSVEQIIEPNKKFITVRANFNSSLNNFILDLNFMVLADSMNLKTTSKSQIDEILDGGNIKLYNIFVSSLTSEAKQLLK